jgi:hypothetical protein
MFPPQIVFAYHGCDESVARMVLDGGQLKPSLNDYDWLGHGIYFWEGSPLRAMRWAIEAARRKNSHIRVPAALGAIVDLGNSLNLVESESAAMVAAAHSVYLERCKAGGVPPLKNKGAHSKARYLDCAVMNTLHQMLEAGGLPAFDTVRGFFIEGQPVYPTAGLRSLDHVQVCVRNSRRIMGFFRPNLTR